METYKCPICGNTDIHSIEIENYLNNKKSKKDTKEKMSYTRLLQPLCACSL